MFQMAKFRMALKNLDNGLTSWQHGSNHNRLIDFQSVELRKQQTGEKTASEDNSPVELTFFGSSAFRITTPAGLTIMLDPWRNHPSRKWDWYFQDFPLTQVDIGISTHAHFDHDALHRLDSSMLLDRMVGQLKFSDVLISGIADKHATDSSAALYDFKNIILEFDGIDITPPDNPRSWDNTLITVETGGLRILHWGDNRHNPPDTVLQALGSIDVLILPIDNSQHVLSYSSIEKIISRVKPKLVIPSHYYIWDVVQRQSTLQPVSSWLEMYKEKIIDAGQASYQLSTSGIDEIAADDWKILYFGDHVGFDTDVWRNG